MIQRIICFKYIFRKWTTFEIVVEIRKINYVAIHKNVSTNVDKILRSDDLILEIRTLSSDGSFKSSKEKKYNKSFIEPPKTEINHFSKINTHNQNNSKTKKIFIFGLPKNIIYESAEILDSKILFTNTPEEADIFVTTKQHYSRRPSAIRKAEKSGIPVHVIRRASRDQINQFINRFSQNNLEA